MSRFPRRSVIRVGVLPCLFAVAPAVHAQLPRGPDSTTNPLSAALVSLYVEVRDNVIKSAEEMPDADYGFRPAPSVRTFAGILGHIADAEYLFCSASTGGSNPHTMSAAKTLTTKGQLVPALQAAFAYCDPVYAGLRDAALAEPVKIFGYTPPRLRVLVDNVSHTNEHYGNIVTYLRIKGLVPPSSAPAPKMPAH